MKNIIKYVPIIGLWFGLPFIKNKTKPVNNETHQKVLNEEFLGILYHFVCLMIIFVVILY